MTTQHYVILIVEDDPAINAIVSEFLHEEGYKVLSCASGTEALQVVARVKPDVVIADMQMETRDAGLRLLTQLRQDPAMAPIGVIICSADSFALTRNAGAIGHYGAEIIPKPFDLTHLLHTIQQLLLGRAGAG